MLLFPVVVVLQVEECEFVLWLSVIFGCGGDDGCDEALNKVWVFKE